MKKTTKKMAVGGLARVPGKTIPSRTAPVRESKPVKINQLVGGFDKLTGGFPSSKLNSKFNKGGMSKKKC